MATFNVIETSNHEGELISQFLCGDQASKQTRDMFNIKNSVMGTVLVAIDGDEDGVTNLLNIDINVIKEIVELTKHTYWMKSILKDNGFEKAEG